MRINQTNTEQVRTSDQGCMENKDRMMFNDVIPNLSVSVLYGITMKVKHVFSPTD